MVTQSFFDFAFLLINSTTCYSLIIYGNYSPIDQAQKTQAHAQEQVAGFDIRF